MLPRISPLAVAAALCAALFVALPVTAQQDVTPPTLLDVSFEPEVIDTGKGPVTVTVIVRVTDDLSGLYNGVLAFSLPGTTQERRASLYGTLTQGTNTDGIYTTHMVLPQYSGYGEWVMTSYWLSDNVGNLISGSRPDSQRLDGLEWPAIFNGFGFVIAADDSDLPFRIFVPTAAHFAPE